MMQYARRMWMYLFVSLETGAYNKGLWVRSKECHHRVRHRDHQGLNDFDSTTIGT